MKEPPPPQVPALVKPQEPSPVKVTSPIVNDAKKETPAPVVPSPVATNLSANCTTEKKIPSSTLETDKEAKGQSPVATPAPAPVNNGNSTPVVNVAAAVGPPKAD